MFRTAGLSVLALALLSGAASADVLWNQSPIDTSPTSQSFLDGTIIGGFGGTYSNYVLNDVTVPASGWNIQSVTTYFSNISFPTVTSAVLNIIPKTGSLPTAANDPRPSVGSGMLVVPVIGGFQDNGQAVMTVTADNLAIALVPGEYWIGLSPTLPGGFFGSELHWSTTSFQGVASASRFYDSMGPGSWGNDLPGVDAAIRIDGLIPAPGAMSMFALGAVFAGRRRR